MGHELASVVSVTAFAMAACFTCLVVGMAGSRPRALQVLLVARSAHRHGVSMTRLLPGVSLRTPRAHSARERHSR